MRGNWQDYYWQDASRGHSAELLVWCQRSQRNSTDRSHPYWVANAGAVGENRRREVPSTRHLSYLFRFFSMTPKSRMRRNKTPEPIWMKFCMWVSIRHRPIYVTFQFGDHRKHSRNTDVPCESVITVSIFVSDSAENLYYFGRLPLRSRELHVWAPLWYFRPQIHYLHFSEVKNAGWLDYFHVLGVLLYYTISSATADGPRDAMYQSKSCQRQHMPR